MQQRPQYDRMMGIKSAILFILTGALCISLAGCARFGFIDAGGAIDAESDAESDASEDAHNDVADDSAMDDVDPSDSGVDGDGAPGQSYSDVVLEDTPVVYFRFDEPEGVSLVGDVDSGFQGRIIGPVLLGAPGLVAGDNTAAWFDGAHGAIDFDDVLDLAGATEFTFEVWIEVEDKSSFWRRIFWKAGDIENVGEMGYNMSIIDHTLIVAARGTDGGATVDIRNPAFDETLAASDNLLHVVWTYDSVNMRLFINNEQVDMQATNVVLPDTPFNLVVGAHVNGYNTFGGTIDELAIYDYGLLPGQIERHYRAGLGLSL